MLDVALWSPHDPVKQMIAESQNCRCAESAGMLPRSSQAPMEFQVPPRPVFLSALLVQNVMLHAQNLPQLVRQFRFGVGDHQRNSCRKHFTDRKIQ